MKEKRKIEKIGVIGAGQMGRGIAETAAIAGFTTSLFDVSEASLTQGLSFIKGRLEKATAKQKLSEGEAQRIFELIRPCQAMQDLADCDLIIEAATENPSVKFEIFRNLSSFAKETCLFGLKHVLDFNHRNCGPNESPRKKWWECIL